MQNDMFSKDYCESSHVKRGQTGRMQLVIPLGAVAMRSLIEALPMKITTETTDNF
jgi:hypothetical protein